MKQPEQPLSRKRRRDPAGLLADIGNIGVSSSSQPSFADFLPPLNKRPRFDNETAPIFNQMNQINTAKTGVLNASDIDAARTLLDQRLLSAMVPLNTMTDLNAANPSLSSNALTAAISPGSSHSSSSTVSTLSRSNVFGLGMNGQMVNLQTMNTPQFGTKPDPLSLSR